MSDMVVAHLPSEGAAKACDEGVALSRRSILLELGAACEAPFGFRAVVDATPDERLEALVAKAIAAARSGHWTEFLNS